MFDIHVSNTQKQFAIDLVRRASIGVGVDASGDFDMQVTGMIGQVVITDYLGLPRPKAKGSDNGSDIFLFGNNIDIKTMGRNVPMRDNYVHNFMGRQIVFNTQIYLFASYNKKKDILTVCGWLPKEEFMAKSKHFPQHARRYRSDGTYFEVRGKDGMYEIENSKLNQLNSMEEFVIAMYRNRASRLHTVS